MPRIQLTVSLLAFLFLSPSLASAQALGGKAAEGRLAAPADLMKRNPEVF